MSEGGGGAGASGGGGGASGGGGGYGGGGSGGSGGGGAYKGMYGLGDNPHGSGIGTIGQEGRTQNKSFAEILALAPPPRFMGVTPSQGVMPGDKVGAGASRAQTPAFLSHKDEGSDTPSFYAGSEVQKLAGQGVSKVGELYEKLFGKDKMTGGRPGDSTPYPEEYPGAVAGSGEASASPAQQMEQPYDPGGLTEFEPTHYSTPALGNFGGAY